MDLWNFRTGNLDTNVNIADTNVKDYYPASKILDNIYAVHRDLGSNARQSYELVLQRVTWPQIG